MTCIVCRQAHRLVPKNEVHQYSTKNSTKLHCDSEKFLLSPYFVPVHYDLPKIGIRIKAIQILQDRSVTEDILFLHTNN